MHNRFTRRILSHMADTRYEPRTLRELARDLNIAADQLAEFKQAADQLLEEGQVIRGSTDTIALPPPGKEVVGSFRLHERGFGFVVPDELTEHGDLFVPPGKTGDALTGDRVRAKVVHERGRAGGGRSPYTAIVVEILQRADRRYAGQLLKKGKQHYVQVDGRVLHDPVIIRDPHAKNAQVGQKVVIELVHYPGEKGELPEGVIIEVLGESGEPDVETLSVMRAYGLLEKFDDQVLAEARRAAERFDAGAVAPGRENLTAVFTCTIDPPDARDFDDAITLTKLEDAGDAAWELGVHIADVSHFVQAGSALDAEAYDRGNSTYLPRRVLPMLPELLSNGVCSLQEGVNRLTKSCFIRFDKDGHPLGQRFANAVIRSDKRLTYLEAQALIDGDLRQARKHAATEPRYPRQLSQALSQMNELAKVIRARRMRDGMIVLALPEVELIFDESGRVIDAQPEDDAFTHTLIEMFMVEANEAAARVFDSYQVPMIRRIHPDPETHDISDLRSFARVAGFNIPANPSRSQLQQLLESVRGKPAEHAVHLAVLKTLSKAEYSPLLIGHFALASEHYTHFTSPIRRYPDLVVHRALDAMLDQVDDAGGKRKNKKRIGRDLANDSRVPNEDRLSQIGRHCSTTERNAESAERELRCYLVLELLSTHLGEDYHGTVTGVTSSGVFVELDKFCIDGFVRSADLPGQAERWRLNPNTGALVAQRSGQAIAIGHRFVVRIANVDLGRRQMELVVVEELSSGKGKRLKRGQRQGASQAKSERPRRQANGARKAHQASQKLKAKKARDAKAQSQGGKAQGKSKPKGKGKRTTPKHRRKKKP